MGVCHVSIFTENDQDFHLFLRVLLRIDALHLQRPLLGLLRLEGCLPYLLLAKSHLANDLPRNISAGIQDARGRFLVPDCIARIANSSVLPVQGVADSAVRAPRDSMAAYVGHVMPEFIAVNPYLDLSPIRLSHSYRPRICRPRIGPLPQWQQEHHCQD